MIPVGVIVHKVIVPAVGGEMEAVHEILIGEQGAAADFPEGMLHFIEPFDRKMREKLFKCFVRIVFPPLFKFPAVQFYCARRYFPALRRIRFVDE